MRNTKTYIGIFITLLGALILVGILSAFYVGKFEDARLRKAFSVKTEMVSRSLDSQTILNLHGTPEDLNNPSYKELKEKMREIKKADPAARFVYLMGYENNQMFFYVDSEPEGSEDYSAPGDVYTDATPEQIAVFFNKTPFIEGPYTDSWGNWVSATAPIYDFKTGATIAVIGIDINSQEWKREVWSAEIIPIVIILFSIILLVIFFINRLRTAMFIERLTRYNELIKQFVYFASHQLRTPLSGIGWATDELMNSNTTLSVEQRSLIQKIKELNKKMLALMRDFLDMSRIERDGKIFITKEYTQISTLIKKVAEDNKPEADKKNISIVVDLSTSAERQLYIDKDRIYLALDNLISNAVKYSHSGGTVKIHTQISSHKYTIHVVDSGIGVPKTEQSHLFSNFYRAKNAKNTEGTGIGLYLVKMIMKAHDGSVNFSSVENKGSDFYLELPF